MKKTGNPSKYAPRTINEHAWYYVNDGSVDVIAETPKTKVVTSTRIPRKVLTAMLAELKPLKP
jgi:hypothetical protein